MMLCMTKVRCDMQAIERNDWLMMMKEEIRDI